MRFFRCSVFFLVATLFAALAWSQVAKTPTTIEQQPAQKLYSSPEEAMQDLIEAAKNKDRSTLRAILGPDVKELVSDDAVEQQNELENFSQMAATKAELQQKDKSTYVMNIGSDDWPFPIPIVESGGKWRFDTKAGTKELLARRIGRNELQTALACQAYAHAQWDYFLDGDWDGDKVQEFAQKFVSTPGRKDGLYWPVKGDEKPSPLGPLMAEAAARGYTPKGPNAEPTPYNGYYFRILKAQGPGAPGGRHGYVVNGNMINGFALVAYPAKYGSTGITTFIVNQQGRVYQKDLGPQTATIARAMTEYNPDKTWTMAVD